MIDHDVGSPVAEAIRAAHHRVDSDGRTGLALGAALVAMALVTGLSFTFAAAVMPNMAGADDHTFVATAQRYNDNPVFPLTFTVALVVPVIAFVLQRRHSPRLATRWTIAALALYGIALAVTFGIHVPLNNEIDQAGDPDRIADLAHVRNQFETPWVAWNIVRTVVSTAAIAALARALFLHARRPADPKAPDNASPAAWPPPPGAQS